MQEYKVHLQRTTFKNALLGSRSIYLVPVTSVKLLRRDRQKTTYRFKTTFFPTVARSELIRNR